MSTPPANLMLKHRDPLSNCGTHYYMRRTQVSIPRALHTPKRWVIMRNVVVSKLSWNGKEFNAHGIVVTQLNISDERILQLFHTVLQERFHLSDGKLVISEASNRSGDFRRCSLFVDIPLEMIKYASQWMLNVINIFLETIFSKNGGNEMRIRGIFALPPWKC